MSMRCVAPSSASGTRVGKIRGLHIPFILSTAYSRLASYTKPHKQTFPSLIHRLYSFPFRPKIRFTINDVNLPHFEVEIGVEGFECMANEYGRGHVEREACN